MAILKQLNIDSGAAGAFCRPLFMLAARWLSVCHRNNGKGGDSVKSQNLLKKGGGMPMQRKEIVAISMQEAGYGKTA